MACLLRLLLQPTSRGSLPREFSERVAEEGGRVEAAATCDGFNGLVGVTLEKRLRMFDSPADDVVVWRRPHYGIEEREETASPVA